MMYVRQSYSANRDRLVKRRKQNGIGVGVHCAASRKKHSKDEQSRKCNSNFLFQCHNRDPPDFLSFYPYRRAFFKKVPCFLKNFQKRRLKLNHLQKNVKLRIIFAPTAPCITRTKMELFLIFHNKVCQDGVFIPLGGLIFHAPHKP